mmetsp:Transcript_90969/g.257581  ORF Transcript_90969/g.257581 Transcript_90969/m.257581 type:complete len:851 (+) Transcript_90969:250-2802(+)
MRAVAAVDEHPGVTHLLPLRDVDPLRDHIFQRSVTFVRVELDESFVRLPTEGLHLAALDPVDGARRLAILVAEESHRRDPWLCARTWLLIGSDHVAVDPIFVPLHGERLGHADVCTRASPRVEVPSAAPETGLRCDEHDAPKPPHEHLRPGSLQDLGVANQGRVHDTGELLKVIFGEGWTFPVQAQTADHDVNRSESVRACGDELFSGLHDIGVVCQCRSALCSDLGHHLVDILLPGSIHHDLGTARCKEEGVPPAHPRPTTCHNSRSALVAQFIALLGALGLRTCKHWLEKCLSTGPVAHVNAVARIAHTLPLSPLLPLHPDCLKRIGAFNLEFNKSVIGLPAECLDQALFRTEDASRGFADLMAQVDNGFVGGLLYPVELPLGCTERHRPEVVGHPREANRAHNVDVDVVVEAFHGQRLRHGCQRHLCSPVVALAPVAVQPRLAGHNHDSAVLLPNHVGPDCLQDVEVPKDVCVHKVREVLDLHHFEPVIVKLASIADQDIHLAKVIDGCRHQVVSRDSEVAVLGNRGATHGSDLCNDLIGLLRRAVVHHYLRAPRGQELRVGAAEPAAAARDNRHFAVEAEILLAVLLDPQRPLRNLCIRLEGGQGPLHVVLTHGVRPEAEVFQNGLLESQQLLPKRSEVFPQIRLCRLQGCKCLLGRRVRVGLQERLLEGLSLGLGPEGLVGDRLQILSKDRQDLPEVFQGRHVVTALRVIPASDQKGLAVEMDLASLQAVSLVVGALLQPPRTNFAEGRERLCPPLHATDLPVLGVGSYHLVKPLLVDAKPAVDRPCHVAHKGGQLLRILHHVLAPGTHAVQGLLALGSGPHVHDLLLDAAHSLDVVHLGQACWL